MKSAKARLFERGSGSGKYRNVWINIPSKLIKDDSFPFSENEDVIIEIKKGSLLIRKTDELIDIINNYGIENATLPKLIEKKVEENKDHQFLHFKDKSYTFDEINQNSNKIANGLLKIFNELKLKKRLKISILLPNCPEFIFCWFGSVKAGAVFTPIDTSLERNDLEYVLNNSDTAILILDYKYYRKLEEIKKKLPKIKKIIIKNAPKSFNFNDFIIKYEDMLSSNIKNPKIDVKDWHPMEILHTSGTTGTPKGVIWRNYLVLTGINVGKELVKVGLDNKSIIYCPLPLFHGISQILVILPALFYNASVIITEQFDPSTFWEDIQKHHANSFIFFGSILMDLMNQPLKNKEKEHHIKWAFGFGAEEHLWDSFEKRFGIPLYVGWTLTEAVGITINTIGSKGGKIGSVGESISGYEFKIVGPDGKKLPSGRANIGEIVSRSTMPIPLGYYGDIEWKEEKNRWFHTKDYGYTDNDGFLYYLGRESDFFHVDEHHFFASEIESIVNKHSDIYESAALCVSDREGIFLVAVKKQNSKLTANQLYEYLSQNLETFMIPRYIEFINILPKTSSTLIKKRILKEKWEDKQVSSKVWDTKLKDFMKQK
ncbi:MAG: AMP-binding protein [Promethearchaeota archaeon]